MDHHDSAECGAAPAIDLAGAGRKAQSTKTISAWSFQRAFPQRHGNFRFNQV